MSTHSTKTTRYYPVAVTVELGTHEGGYVARCDPESLTITHENSVIMYQIVKAPEGVEFWSLNIEPTSQREFKPPQIGAQGRMLTIDDIDREKTEQRFHVDLLFTDPYNSSFQFDPQVINRPG